MSILDNKEKIIVASMVLLFCKLAFDCIISLSLSLHVIFASSLGADLKIVLTWEKKGYMNVPKDFVSLEKQDSMQWKPVIFNSKLTDRLSFVFISRNFFVTFIHYATSFESTKPLYAI